MSLSPEEKNCLRRTTPAQLAKYDEQTALAYAPHVFFPDSVYEDLMGDNPGSESLRLFTHEKAHVERQATFLFGVRLWWWLYEHWPKFHISEEWIAILAEMQLYLENGKEYPIRGKRDILSGSLHHHWFEANEVERALNETWEKMKQLHRERL